MATPYEVEHNIKDKPQGQTRRPDMSSFFNQISQISTASTEQETHNNAHATPTPVEMAAAHRLLREQYETLLQNAGGREMNLELLERLIAEEEAHIDNPPEKVEGVPQSYLDTLERVDKRRLKKTDTCPICAEPFLDDPYPLVVRLPCHDTHLFDLECVGPWLRLNGTCPLDRKDLMKKKEVPKKVEYDDDDEEDNDMMYA